MGFFGNLFDKLKSGLQKTKDVFVAPIKKLVSLFRNLDPENREQLLEIMLAADFGPELAEKLLDEMQASYKSGKIKTGADVEAFFKAELKKRLTEHGNELRAAAKPPTVILVCGVNGVGKTTSIAKLASLFKKDGKKVMLAASDTFRAAAVEQLTIWSERLGVEIVKHKMGADPAAVAYDAVEAAVARNFDVLIVDTAGRLQTKENLMKELSKIRNVITKKIPDAPHEVLLVLDATTGQNAISQAQHFTSAVNVTGIFLAKLDGTAKGGAVFSIKDRLKIPVKFVGTGEGADDVAQFNADEFVEALFAE